jgi:hypothetical protein
VKEEVLRAAAELIKYYKIYVEFERFSTEKLFRIRYQYDLLKKYWIYNSDIYMHAAEPFEVVSGP